MRLAVGMGCRALGVSSRLEGPVVDGQAGNRMSAECYKSRLGSRCMGGLLSVCGGRASDQAFKGIWWMPWH
jgi:hypothetical protein